MTITVKATKRGYYGGRVYAAGQTFEVEDRKAIGSWMSPVVEEVKAPKSEKGGKGKAEQPAADASDLA